MTEITNYATLENTILRNDGRDYENYATTHGRDYKTMRRRQRLQNNATAETRKQCKGRDIKKADGKQYKTT